MVSEALLGMCTCALKKCDVRRKVCVERLGSVRSIHRTALVNRVTHTKASLQRAERPRANSLELPRLPCSQSYASRIMLHATPDTSHMHNTYTRVLDTAPHGHLRPHMHINMRCHNIHAQRGLPHGRAPGPAHAIVGGQAA